MTHPENNVSSSGNYLSSLEWFCVQTHQKHEHIAAAQLRQEADIEVFLPRIRFRRSTRCGPVWASEALFPNYLFARFDLTNSWRRVQNARSVRGIVHFGSRWPTIPGSTIEDLRTAMGPDEIRVVRSNLHPGEEVEILKGALAGLQAVVARVMPNRQRVAILMDFLGRQTSVDLPVDQVVPSGGFRPLGVLELS
jgi:transcriptional antiterminator RfaH